MSRRLSASLIVGCAAGCSARHGRWREDLSCPGVRALLEDDEPAGLVGGPEVDSIEEVIAGSAVGVDGRRVRGDVGDPGSQQPSGNGRTRFVLRVDSRAGHSEPASRGSQVRLDHWHGRVDGDQRFDGTGRPVGADDPVTPPPHIMPLRSTSQTTRARRPSRSSAAPAPAAALA